MPLALYRLDVPGGGEEVGSVLRRIVDGLRVAFLDPMQRAITMPRAILDLIDAVAATVLVLYIIREVGLSPGLMGLAFALSSVGFVAGSLIAPRVERRLDIGGMIVLGLPGLIGGTGGVIQCIGLTALRQSRTPERLRDACGRARTC